MAATTARFRRLPSIDLREERLDRLLPPLLVGVAILQIVAQAFAHTGLSYDAAQIVLWAQRPILGGTDQPTLISNLAWAFARLGLHPADFVTILRPLAVLGAMLVTRRALGWWTPSPAIAWSGALALGLLPDVMRGALLKLTHTPLMLLALSVALYALARATPRVPDGVGPADARPSVGAFMGLGLSAAFVFNAKINGLLFLLALGPAALVSARARRVVGDRRLIAALVVFLIGVSPALVGLALNVDILTYGQGGKFRTGASVAGGGLETIASAVESLTPLAMFVAAALALRLRDGAAPRPLIDRDALRMLLAQGVSIILFFVIAAELADAGRVKRTWLLPGCVALAIAAGLWTASRLNARRRALLAATLAVFWILATAYEHGRDFGLLRDRLSQGRTDFDPLVELVDARARPGDVVAGPMRPTGFVVWRRPALWGWVGQTAWRPPAPGGAIHLVWSDREPLAEGLLERLRAEGVSVGRIEADASVSRARSAPEADDRYYVMTIDDPAG